MPCCSVVTCTNNHHNRPRGTITYHRFPSNEVMRETWLESCGRPDTFNAVTSRVCSDHFNIDDFERDLQSELLGQPSRKRLKKLAVPHLNLIRIKKEPIDACEELDSTIADGTTDSSSEFSAIMDHVGELTAQIEVPQTMVLSVPPPREGPSSLPATQNWPGSYDFNVSFGPQENISKGVAWTYSGIKDKLYVGKDVKCPINFSTNSVMPNGVFIRALALFSMSEHVSDVVHRCVNHSMEELKRKIPEAEHLIRCESEGAAYETDPHTRRHSVLVPFENSPDGQSFSTYIFKFACFGSCAGGPNRRPLMVIFTLENGKEVIGRKKLYVKICACPGRDRRTDEQQCTGTTESALPQKRKGQSEFMNLSDTFKFINGVSVPVSVPKKNKLTPNADGFYTITAQDQLCFEFLKQMKKFYDICSTMRKLSPDVKQSLIWQHRKKEDSD